MKNPDLMQYKTCLTVALIKRNVLMRPTLFTYLESLHKNQWPFILCEEQPLYYSDFEIEIGLKFVRVRF